MGSTAGQSITAQQLLGQLAGHCFDRQLLKGNSEVIRKGLPPNRQLLVAAMPKTGSTWLVKTLAAVTGRPYNLCSYSEDDTERLYFPTLARDCLLREAVTKLHCPATAANLELVYAFHMTPVVQVRNLFDAVVSQRDHLVQEGERARQPTRRMEHFLSLDEPGQYDLVIDTWVPRVLAFFESWQIAEQENDWLRLHWVDYDALNANPVGTIEGVLVFLNLPADRGAIRLALDRLPGAQTRKNKAVPGRGKFLLGPGQKRRIEKLAANYAWVDFRALGFDSSEPALVRAVG